MADMIKQKRHNSQKNSRELVPLVIFSEASMSRLEFFEEANIVLGEHSKVLDTVFQVGDAFDAHTECEARVNFAVDAASFEHIGVYHTAAQDFHPTGAFAECAALAAAEVARDVHFSRWLGEWEVRRAKTNLGFGTEHFLSEIEQYLLEVGKSYIFVDVESFHLVEEAVSASRDSLVAIHTTRADDADRRLSVLHNAALHR